MTGHPTHFPMIPISARTGFDQVKSGDRVTVTYTGILSEIESFTGEIISIEKVKQ